MDAPAETLDTPVGAPLVSLAELEGPEALPRLFGRRAPLEIEIGCGKGRFLLRCAALFPEADFLGIERAGRYLRIAAERAARAPRRNLRFVEADAVFVLRELLPGGAARAVHVLFPDPWPKKRHHKRRVIRPELLDGVARVLQPHGVLNVASDHAEAWAAILETLAADARFRQAEAFRLLDRLAPGETGLTHYEVKYRATGRTIRQASWVLAAGE